MQYIFFSKLVRAQGIPELIATLKTIGADGVDLCVRDGYPVSPDNAQFTLKDAAQRLRDAGMVIPMITAPTSLTNPSLKIAEKLFTVCHDVGIPNIKLGYWGYGSGGYWKQVDAARRDLEGFAQLAMRFGVRACVHTHSGNNLGTNAASLMHLIRGFDPAQIGAYLDPGHLALNGEPLHMAFNMAREQLCLVAIKDSTWVMNDKRERRTARFLPLGKGFVDWHEVMLTLKSFGYHGPMSFHSEFDSPNEAYLIEQTRRDIAFLRKIEEQVRDGAASTRKS